MKRELRAVFALGFGLIVACQAPEDEVLTEPESSVDASLQIPAWVGVDEEKGKAVATETSRGALTLDTGGIATIVLSTHRVARTVFGAESGPVELPVVVDRAQVEVGAVFATLSLEVPVELLEMGRAYRLSDLPSSVVVRWTHWIAPPTWFEEDPLCDLTEAYGDATDEEGSPVRLCVLEMWQTETYVGGSDDAEILLTVNALNASPGGMVALSVEFRGVEAALDSSGQTLACCCDIDNAFPRFSVEAILDSSMSFDSFTVPSEHHQYMLYCSGYDTAIEAALDPACHVDI